MKLSELPNIGPEIERQLKDVGIETYDELKELGSMEAWLKIRAVDSSACINRLYSLEGAIEGIKKSELPLERKTLLKDFYNLYK